MDCIVNSAFVRPRCASEFNQWRLLRGRCRGSSSVCTRRCWTAVSSLHLSGCPYCVIGPGWPGAWMALSPPMTLRRCPGPARRQSDGSRAAGSPGWGSRVQIFASWPSERPWCSAGCHSAVDQGKALVFSKPGTPKMCNASSNGHDLDNLFGLAVLNPPLCVADVQVFGVLRVEVSHNVCPPLRESPMFTGSKTRGEYSWEGLGQGLLFTVDGRVFPTGLTNKNPVFHFVYREGSP